MSKGLAGVATFVIVVRLAGQGAIAQETKPAGRGHRPTETSTFNVKVPAHDYDLLLARPEKTAVTLSVLAYLDSEALVAYGTKPGTYTAQTPVQAFKKGTPVEIVVKDLQLDTAYVYQFRWRPLGTVTERRHLVTWWRPIGTCLWPKSPWTAASTCSRGLR